MNYIISTKNAPNAIGPYSQAIKVNHFLMISGQIPIDVRSGEMPKTIEEQTYLVLKNIKSIIDASELKVKNIIKTTIFSTDLRDFDAINHIYQTFFINNQSTFPARSFVEVKKLPKNAKIEIEAIAFFK
ncbi:Rid family detoxifying hydrolase [Buchnera aphidicola]|uniref:Rid family detoxifying hydrolase n=1 Tax=Buchnera aphidicola TaxID=9 RepID=UPI003BEEEB82